MLKTILEMLSVFLRAILFRLGFGVRPYKVCWLITWRCNLSCNYCEIGKANQEQLRKEELSAVEIIRMLPELRRQGVKFITFAGGEPLMYEDIFTVLKSAREQGFIVGLVTNGTLIDEGIARKLAEVRVDHIHISLDSPDTIQDIIRHSQNCFSKIDQAFRHLLKYRPRGGYHLGIACVVSGFNYDKLEKVFDYAEKMSLNSVALQPFFVSQIRNKEMITDFSVAPEKAKELEEKIKYLLKRYRQLIRNSSFYTRNVARYFRDPKLRGTHCYGGGLTINIFPDGVVGPCYYLPANGAGSVRNKNITEIMRSRPYGEILKRVRRRDCPTCWCAVVHEYDLFFRPLDIFRSLYLLHVARSGK